MGADGWDVIWKERLGYFMVWVAGEKQAASDDTKKIIWQSP